jgi:hypothetical protein
MVTPVLMPEPAIVPESGVPCRTAAASAAAVTATPAPMTANGFMVFVFIFIPPRNNNYFP